MKTIGLLGGMSWESTVPYYQVINEMVRDRLGGLHSAKILMYSVDFEEIERNMSAGNWDRCAEILSDYARRLETAGADMILICTNTLHNVAPKVQAGISVPLLHIAKATAGELKAAGISRVGLLGTRYTMTQPFYRDVLAGEGFEVLVPEGGDIDRLNAVIFDELCVGVIREESRQFLLRAIDALCRRGAQGVILGCTELDMLVSPGETDVPLFDTTLIHAKAAALAALQED